MKKTHSSLFILLLILASCNSTATVQEVKSNSQKFELKSESAEKEPAQSNYTPAFPEQTRAPEIVTEVTFDIIADEMGRPWGIIEMPDNTLLITDKFGSLNVYSKNGALLHTIENLPEVDARAQGGLLDVVLHPNFYQNKKIFFTFSEPFNNGNLTSLAAATLNLNDNKLENTQIVYRAKPSYDGVLHYGSRLIFDENNNLYMTTGERSDQPMRKYAQRLDSGLGKVLRFTENGEVHPENPNFDQEALPEIFTYGHRNPQGIDMHPKTKQIYAVEFGPLGGDEVNILEPGANYGWGDISYGLEYNGEKINEGKTQKEGTKQPLYYWDPAVSPSGIAFFDSDNFPAWQNDLIVAGLGSRQLIRLKVENGKVIGEGRFLQDERERFRDVVVTNEGVIFAITDSGKLYKITPQ